MNDEITIDGVKYRRVDRIANRVSSYVMYDCHLFRQLKGSTVDELIADWRSECAKPDEKYGRPSLCPLIVLDGKQELRRVGPMVFFEYTPPYAINEKQLNEWREKALADPDITRILAAEGKEEGR